MTPLEEELRAAFRVEHAEYLAGLRGFLGRLGGPPGSVPPGDADEAFRMAHSLKAAARACDLDAVAEVGQRLEAFFGRLRKGTLHPGPDAVAAARAALDATEGWAEGRPDPPAAELLAALDRVLTAPEADPKPADPNDLTARLREAFRAEHREHLEGIRAALAAVEAGDPPAGWVNEAFRRAHSLKGAARIAEVAAAETLAHRLESLFARVREGTLEPTPAVLRAVHLGLDAIEDAASADRPPAGYDRAVAALEGMGDSEGPRDEGRGIKEEAPPTRASDPGSSLIPQPSSLAEVVRVRADHLDRLLRSAGQLQSEALRQGLLGRDLTALDRRLEGMGKEWAAVRAAAAGELRRLAGSPRFARVAHYLAFVEQQVRELTKAVRATRRGHRRGAWALRQLAGRVHADAGLLRLVAAESVLQGFGKMVRDLARDEGKEVEFRADGLNLRADREVLQALKDPLMHLLANAVTHGVERPAERAAANKPPAARVALRLEAAGNRLRASVEDDGRGIDPRAVAETAVRRGLLTGAEAAARSSAELVRLIFEPGFTTAGRVTGAAGRGMGLSVVHEAVTRLQGDVELVPAEGPGTRFVLTVPLSVSTQRLLLVACRGQTYAIPVHAIDRLVRARPADIESVEGKPMLLDAGRPVPVVGLAGLLGLGESPPADGPVPLAVVRGRGRRVAVAVDGFVAERDALVKPLDDPAARVAAFAGGVVLEDGSVALVLNPAELVADSAHKAIPVAAPGPAEKKAPTVLVVDDSLTTRTLEKSILEVHGYTVRLAVDGLEALAQLRAGPADLVITDIEMPRLDGFGLLAEMKKDPRLAKVPVIVVTSLARREDQERGLTLGADAYIVKRKFDHEELLGVIRQVL